MEPAIVEVKKVFAQSSERVKSVDFHPTEPWFLASLYSGTVCIWNHQSKTIEKSFKISDSPVRSAKFIPRENWIVACSDDKFIRVYNYNTMEKIKEIEAHTDYIRSLVIHPTLPYVFSSSDDKLIKVWDWEQDWKCTEIFQGHSHYVMQLAINPSDVKTFASVSLDGTIKGWSLGCDTPLFTIDSHGKGINCVNYFAADNKLCLVTGDDDHSVKIWDYETKSCVKTLEGHKNNVTDVCVHPEIPVIITTSEDGDVCIWDAITYKLLKTLNYEFKRVWAIGYMKGSSKVVFGYDEGIVMVEITSSEEDEIKE